MRGTFLDNDRKVRDTNRSGSDTDEIFKPKWPLYSRLQFLKKTIASAPSLSNFVPPTPHLLPQSQCQSQSHRNYQDASNIVNSPYTPIEETSYEDENTEMQFYYDQPSQVTVIYINIFNMIYDT